MRVDFAGGWLDVPRLARTGAFIVNCTISPLVSLYEWPYEKCSGMGGSGAHAMLMAEDGVEAELANDVGWQDPAVIQEMGLCVWRSGARPVLEVKINPAMLIGKMAIHWTGQSHVTRDLVEIDRDYDRLAEASVVARDAVLNADYEQLCDAVRITYEVQLEEGMMVLPDVGEKAKKYCGSGHGGYGVYMFATRPERDDLMPVEPYMATFFQ